MLRFPQETLVEIVAFLRRFDLDVVELTSQQFRRAVSALSVKPLRRLEVVSLTNDSVIIAANGLRHSFELGELRVSFCGLLRLTHDSIFNELRIQFVSRESDNLIALRRLLSDRLTMTLRMSYADMSGCGSNDILRIAGAVIPGGKVFLNKKALKKGKTYKGQATASRRTKVCLPRTSASEFMRSLAANGLRSLKASKGCTGSGCTDTELLAFMSPSANAEEESRVIELEDSARLSHRFVHKLVESAKTGKLYDFDARISDRSVPELDVSGFERYRTTRPTSSESVAAYEFRSLGLKVMFLRDSTELQIAYRKN